MKYSPRTERKRKVCGKCWWLSICSRTRKACNIIQSIDMRWEDSPNNKRKEINCLNSE